MQAHGQISTGQHDLSTVPTDCSHLGGDIEPQMGDDPGASVQATTALNHGTVAGLRTQPQHRERSEFVAGCVRLIKVGMLQPLLPGPNSHLRWSQARLQQPSLRGIGRGTVPGMERFGIGDGDQLRGNRLPPTLSGRIASRFPSLQRRERRSRSANAAAECAVSPVLISRGLMKIFPPSARMRSCSVTCSQTRRPSVSIPW